MKGGINQQIEKASLEEAADALNVWAPDTRVEQRPGYIGLTSVVNSVDVGTQLTMKAEDVSVPSFADPIANVLTVSSLEALAAGVAPDNIYFGESSPFNAIVLLGVTLTNSNATRFQAEYWNGTRWAPIQSIQRFVGGDVTPNLFGLAAQFIYPFAEPKDWVSVAVDSVTLFWIRFSLRNADIDPSCSIGTSFASLRPPMRGIFIPQYPGGKKYIYVTTQTAPTDPTVVTLHDGALLSPNAVTSIFPITSFSLDQTRATIAVVPQFNESFLAIGGLVLRHSEELNTIALAVVEDREAPRKTVGSAVE